MFEFYLNKNIEIGFEIKNTLLESIPDYISLGYNEENIWMKKKGIPIWLTICLSNIIKKTLSIFWHFKTKNLYKLSLYFPINRDLLKCTKAEKTLINMIKSIDTLQEVDLWIKEGDTSNFYSFKNLSKLRREQIIDSIWGLNSSVGILIPDLNSIQVFSDSISILK